MTRSFKEDNGLVYDRHKKRDFLIRSCNGPIQNLIRANTFKL